MKNTTETYYCDVTGEEIDNRFDMLEVTVHRPGEFIKESQNDVHLSERVHSLDYERREDNEYDAYVDETDSVVMIQESGPTRTAYYGVNSPDQEISELIRVLSSSVIEDA